MHQYALFLGREPNISTAELWSVFSSRYRSARIETVSDLHAIVTSKTPLPADNLMRYLGGTIKIAEHIPTKGEMERAIAGYLDAAIPEKKIHFSLAGGSPRLVIEVKKILKDMGRSVRYIEPKNTATILHNRLVERKSDLTIVDGALYATAAIQPIDEWSARDYGRPGRDSKSGMLPPKLARIMVNLAEMPRDAVLLDPFCGSGTILTEAMHLGYAHLIGSDMSPKAIIDAKKNAEWMGAGEGNIQFIISSVQELPKKLQPRSINAIITEPFLGAPLRGNESEAVLKRQTRELTALYSAAFQSFLTLLKPGGVVVWIAPRFKHANTWIRVPFERDVSGFRILRFGKNDPFLLYVRPEQRVGREIWKLKKERCR